MAKMTVRSYVSIEIEIDLDTTDMDLEDIRDEAIDEAGVIINDKLRGLDFDFDFFEDAIVYDEHGEEIEEAVE